MTVPVGWVNQWILEGDSVELVADPSIWAFGPSCPGVSITAVPPAQIARQDPARI